MFDRSKHEKSVSRVGDGETEYRFARPISHQRAMTEFDKAKARGPPSGTVIILNDSHWIARTAHAFFLWPKEPSPGHCSYCGAPSEHDQAFGDDHEECAWFHAIR